MDRTFLNDVYTDLFGDGKPSGEKPVTFPQVPADPAPGNADKKKPAPGNAEKKPVSSNTGKKPDPGIRSEDIKVEIKAPDPGGDALKLAREALEEAKKLFENVNIASSGTQNYLDENLPGMEKIREEVMKDFGLSGNEDASFANGAASAEAKAAEEADAEKEPEEDPMETLDSLIGLDTIKRDVKELMDFVSVQKMRKDEGLKYVPLSLHLVFTGNPGTGKTTVARIIGRLYKKIGVLSKGQLVEVDRSGLVAGYVGQTALKTQDKIAEARGGVLFIDEAYALAQKDDAFGQEAIDTILKAMEDYRDDFVVIVAGYTKPMEKFINSNPGLKSRFNKYIEFPDYTEDELFDIFLMNCRKYDYELEEDAKKHIRELIVLAKLEKPENFANAREVRNLFEKIITKQAKRVKLLDHPSHEDMVRICMEDLPTAPEKGIV